MCRDIKTAPVTVAFLLPRSREDQASGLRQALACRAPELQPRTREQYDILLRLHIVPQLGDLELSKVSPSWIPYLARWHPDPGTSAAI
jgi:hypothetical protein